MAVDILGHFQFEPTAQQKEAARRIEAFLEDRTETKAFILKGFAGTGKTTLLSALVNSVEKAVLLAPTGRAAKVFSQYAGHQAYSIHKFIYRQEAGGASQFGLDYNRQEDTLFVIDEASMIANMPGENNIFGTGRVLDDLIEYIYTGTRCTAIFLGDPAQLLPVGESYSPALDKKVLEGYGLKVEEYWLTEVLRQSAESGILSNATLLRQSIEKEPFELCPLTIGNFEDIVSVNGEDLIESINSSYGHVGEENTIILTNSNKRAVQFNRGIRSQVLYREDRLQAGDLIMVTKNNYYWSKPYANLAFIANGDIAEVVRVGKHYDFYGAHYADLTLRLLDYDMEITAKVMLDSLEAETPAQMQMITEKAASQIVEDYPEVHSKAELWKKMKENPYFNALQVKFAYAITTHKSQGGAWEHVYIDLGYLTDEMINKEFSQWLYTAVTRAKEKLFLINFPKQLLR